MAALGLALATGCDQAHRRPDIVLITLDTTRADHLGCYGHAIASTPHLDRFAQGSVQYMQAVAPVPLTLPAHASMMTGLQPPEHGVRDNSGYHLPEEVVTLAEILRDQGYATAAFVSAYILTPHFGLSQGFQTYDHHPVNERPGAETTRAAIAWLEDFARLGSQPLFLWVHYFDPHTPWTPPEQFASATRGTPYDAEISAMDAAVGDLLAALRRLGRLEAAHVVIVGDHGEGLGDHIEREHGIFLYEETLHVPLMWKLPGQEQGRQTSRLVSTVDLFATILDALRIAIPGGITPGPLERTLENPSAEGAAGVYAETLNPFIAHNWSPLYAWRTPVWKFVEAPESELYDLRTDPEERRNLASDRAAVRESLRTVLDDYRRGLSDVPAEVAERPLSSEAEARLRSLGYVTLGASTQAAASATLADPKWMAPVEVPLAEAQVAAEEGRWSDSEASFRAVLAASPAHPVAQAGLGHALLHLGRPREALVAFERCRQQAPSAVEPLEAMASAYLALGDSAAAVGALRRAGKVASISERVRLLEEETDILLAGGRFEEAAERCTALDRIFAASFGHSTSWRTKAEAASALGALGIAEPSADAGALEVQLRSLAILQMQTERERLLRLARTIHDPALIESLAATTQSVAQEQPRAG